MAVTGNSVEQAAQEALKQGRAEVPWLLMRNTLFREGTQHDGRTALVAAFAEQGVRAKFADRTMPNGTQMEWVLLTPIAPA